MITSDKEKSETKLNWRERLEKEWNNLGIIKQVSFIISAIGLTIYFLYKNLPDVIQTFPRFLTSILIVVILLLEFLTWFFFSRNRDVKKRFVAGFLGALIVIIPIIIVLVPSSRARVFSYIVLPTPTLTSTIIPTPTQTLTPVLTITPTPTPYPSDTPTPISTQTITPTRRFEVKGVPTISPFYIYKDAAYSGNNYTYSGVMGDLGDLTVNESYIPDANAPTETWFEVKYVPEGKGDVNGNHSCPLGKISKSICTWAGAYWLDPADNFGTIPMAGYDLSAYSTLKFRARTKDLDLNVKFLVGGVGWSTVDTPPYPDSIQNSATTNWAHLTNKWSDFSIVLSNFDRSHVIGGFGFVINWYSADPNVVNPPWVFYLDDIRFEK
jgi:hypothetical protein